MIIIVVLKSEVRLRDHEVDIHGTNSMDVSGLCFRLFLVSFFQNEYHTCISSDVTCIIQ